MTEAGATDARRRRVGWGSIRKLPSGLYQARLPPAVDEHRRPIEGSPFRSEQAARTALLREWARHDAGEQVDREALRTVKTVDDAVGRYLSTLEHAVGERLAPNTLRDYVYLRTRVIGHADWGIAGRRLRGAGSVSRADIRSWSNRAGSEYATSTARKALRLLTAAIEDVRADHLIGADITAGITVRASGTQRSAPGERHYLLTAQEIVGLTRHYETVQYPLAIELILWGGLRSEEVRALRAGDVLRGRSCVRISQAVSESGGIVARETKNSRSRNVRIPRGLTSALADYIAANTIGAEGLLFPRVNNQVIRAENILMYSYDLIGRTWAPALAAAGITGDPKDENAGRHGPPTPHDGRSTHVSWLLALGWDDSDARGQLGHSTIVVTKDIYTEVQRVDVRDADASALRLDPNLSPGRKLDLLWEAWRARFAGASAPLWDAWRAGTLADGIE